MKTKIADPQAFLSFDTSGDWSMSCDPSRPAAIGGDTTVSLVLAVPLALSSAATDRVATDPS